MMDEGVTIIILHSCSIGTISEAFMNFNETSDQHALCLTYLDLAAVGV